MYCDFKPDNVMLEGDDVKLIDMGAVRRIGDPSGDIYGTVGYKAPEADNDPVAVSDLYTIGRTLAVLLMDFDNTGRDVASLPAPNKLQQVVPEAAIHAAGFDPARPLRATASGGGPLPAWLHWTPATRAFTGDAPPGVASVDILVGPEGVPATLPLTLQLPLTGNESLYRFLLRATAAAPDARFQSADEMAAQLTGVLRETVARDTAVPAMDSAVFLPERTASGDPAALDGAWRRLPELRLDQADSAAAEIFAAGTVEPEARIAMLAEATRAKPQSSEALLRRAEAVIRAGDADVDRVMALLDKALARLGWPRDALFLTNAVKHFKYEMRGARRIHKTPAQREAAACLQWLEREIELVRPDAVVALGATAARALLGRAIGVTRERGQWLARADGVPVLITLHPSALLRMEPALQAEAFEAWKNDLRLASAHVDPQSPAS